MLQFEVNTTNVFIGELSSYKFWIETNQAIPKMGQIVISIPK